MFKDILVLIQTLIWPALVVFVALLFRAQIAALFGRIRSFEAAGGKAQFDVTVAAKVIEENRNLPANDVAKLLLQYALADPGELRIVRALFGELNGRYLNHYRTIYPEQLRDLQKRGLISFFEDHYSLTPAGVKWTTTYLQGLIDNLQSAEHPH